MAQTNPAKQLRILYLDAYDSFSNNIIAQIAQCTNAEVIRYFIDSDLDFLGEDNSSSASVPPDRTTRFLSLLKGFDGVVAGPGPGWAERDEDVGWMKALWSHSEENMLPVLGIGLGFQSMCVAFGAHSESLIKPRHAVVAEILHGRRSIFDKIDRLEATQYHASQVMIGHRIQKTKSVRYPSELWEPTEMCPDLEPLAWDFDSRKNGAVLMAARHIRKPLWGIQFHPESICTNSQGARIIRDWWDDARSWKCGSEQASTEGSVLHAQRQALVRPIAIDTDLSVDPGICTLEDVALIVGRRDEETGHLPPTPVQCATTGSGRLTVADIVEQFNISSGEAIVLESGLQQDLLPMVPGTGRHSIIGLVTPGETSRIHYYAAKRTMQLLDGSSRVVREWQCPEPWQWIRSCMEHLRRMISSPPTTPTWAPFWGGLMGYASYEAGLGKNCVQGAEQAAYPDICFAYITRSIVVDHQLKKIYIQSIQGAEDGLWIRETWERLYEAAGRKSAESTPNRTPMPRPDPFEQDSTLTTYLASCTELVANRQDYCASVSSCQSQITDGQSYELCLTASNQVRARKPRICRLSRRENNELSWKVYKRLASQSPAPFGAYLRLHNVHVLSASPERFVSWNRTQTAQCVINNTVFKGPNATAAEAHAFFSSPTQRAGNLKAVDQARNGLHGVYGSGDVHVRKLMEIEEHKTLWQLSSVVEGVPKGVKTEETPGDWQDPKDHAALSQSASDDDNNERMYLGYDAFTTSLPPSSVTGAPKKRSCEILQREENYQPRGIYSGVLGYLDVGGGGDFSVVTRTAVKIEDGTSTSSTEDVWSVGAGSAVTAHSTPETEYEDMLARFQCTSRAFRPLEIRPLFGGDEQRKLDELAAVSAAIDGGDEDGADNMARALLGTLENFRAQLETLERETLVLNRGQR